MDQRPTPAATAAAGPPPRGQRPASWHQWVVPLPLAEVSAELTAPPAGRRAGLALHDAAPTTGTLTGASRRWRGSWHHGRHAGPAEVELTRLSPTSTLVELCLRPGAHAHPGLGPGRARRRRVAEEVARRLGVQPPRRRPAEPAIVGLAGPRPAGRPPAVVWAALVLLAFAPTVWALVDGQQPTAVTEERALAEYRARARQLADARAADGAGSDAVTADAAATDGGAQGADAPDDTPPADDEAADEGSRQAAPAQPEQQAGGAASAETDADPAPGPAEDEASAGEPSSASDDAPTAPAPGVYHYATDGEEAIAVPGGSRDYPQRTTITVTEDGCGHLARWSVLDERWDERETCADGRLAGYTSYREFYGVAQKHEFACEEQRPDDAAAREPGAAWPITCEADDAVMEGRIEVVALEEVEVDGTTVEAVHQRLEGELSGDLEGTQRTDRWLSPAHGRLLLRERSRTRATVDSQMGEVDYREDYEIELLDLRPRT